MEPRKGRDPTEQAETNTPSRALAGIGAAMPVFFALSCCVATPLSVAGSPTSFVQEMGGSFFAIVVAGGGAVVTAAVLLFLAGLGRRVPSVFAVGVATLPWVIGLAGARYGMYVVGSAVGSADPSARSSILAMGIAEASLAHIFGAMVSVGTLLGVGLGFAITALGQQAPEKKVLAAALGILALPMLAAGLWLFSIWVLRGPFTPPLVALLSVVVVAAAAAAIGKDTPRHRSGALAVSAATAVALAFVAAASAGATSALVEIFRALAFAEPADRGMLLAGAAAEVAPYQTIAKYGLLLGLIPVLGLAGWAASRVRPSPGRLAGALAMAFVFVVVPIIDRIVVSSGADTMAGGASLPWQGFEGFEPTGLDGVGAFVDPDALLTVAGLATVDAPQHPVALSDRAVASQTLAGLATADDVGGDDYADLLGVQPEVSVGIAIDRRVEAPSLRALFAAASDADLLAVHFVGVSGEALGPQMRAEVAEQLPMLAFLAEPTPSSVRIRLASTLAAPQLARADEVLFATVGPSADVTLAPVDGRGTTTDLSHALELGNRLRPPPSLGYAYLEVGEGASAASYLRAASRAAHLGFEVVAATDGAPTMAAALGDLTGALGALEDAALGSGAFGEIDPAQLDELFRALGGAGGLGLSGMGGSGGGGVGGGTAGAGGGVGATRHDRRPVRVRIGRSTVRGSLAAEHIQRVMRSRVGSFRNCYESALRDNSDLAGNLSLRFTISPPGTVTSSEIRQNASGDEGLGRCVTRTARRLRFPAPAGGGIVIVDQPIEFEAP